VQKNRFSTERQTCPVTLGKPFIELDFLEVEIEFLLRRCARRGRGSRADQADHEPTTRINGSSHRGSASDRRLIEPWPSIVPVHTPVHAGRLNQIEVYFSIVQRKALTPNDFRSPADVEGRLLVSRLIMKQSRGRFSGNSRGAILMNSSKN
jgi:hypothetical protein